MPSLRMNSFNEFLALFNKAIKNNDIPTAVRIGQKIVLIGDEEFLNAESTENEKAFFKSETDKVREILADISSNSFRKKPAASEEKPLISLFNKEPPKGADGKPLGFKDIAGLASLKEELFVNILAPLSNGYKDLYYKYRNDLGVNILLFGPPGTGKTHIVKCLAGQLQCNYALVSVADILSKWVGEAPQQMAKVFKDAEQFDRSIIFFDEIDALAASREDDDSRNTKEVLTTILTCMDGFQKSLKPEQMRIVIAATNRPWALDSALKRGGRFETQILVDLPDYEARRYLIELELGKHSTIKANPNVPMASDVNVDYLAKRLEDYSGADIRAICKRIKTLPMTREIMYYNTHKAIRNDCITKADCEKVIKEYINCITDEMRINFDAYGAGTELADYVKILKELQAKKQPLPNYANRYLAMLEEEEIRQAKWLNQLS